MKIENEIWLSGAAPSPQHNKTTAESSVTTFSEMLAQAEKLSSPTAEMTAPIVQSNSLNWGLPKSASVLGQIDDLLISLERYGQALADSSQSLKQIEPMTKELDNMMKELETKLSQDNSGELNELAGEVLMLGKVELLKFQRGDYI